MRALFLVLLPLQCAAHSRFKRYDKLFPYLARLDDNIRNGDTAMHDIEEMGRDRLSRDGQAMSQPYSAVQHLKPGCSHGVCCRPWAATGWQRRTCEGLGEH